MKNKKNINRLLIICTFFVLTIFSNTNIYAQSKKQKTRVSVSFEKEGNYHFIKINAKYKENKKYLPAGDLNLKAYRIIDNDSLIFLGEMLTNKKGTANLEISKVFETVEEQYDFNIIHETSEKFRPFEKSVSLKIAHLMTELKTMDDKYFIEAKLTNFENEPIEEAELKVQLQRLFSPLPIGKGIFFTDENGIVNVPIEQQMPGVDGKLNYEIVLEDSDEYGTIRSILRTKIGKPIEDLSTFDERTMWSPPGKTPKFFLIYPNLIIFGIWTFIIILTINLYRISKHKNS